MKLLNGKKAVNPRAPFLKFDSFRILNLNTQVTFSRTIIKSEIFLCILFFDIVSALVAPFYALFRDSLCCKIKNTKHTFMLVCVQSDTTLSY